MPYPNLAGKHAYDALITPEDLHAGLRGRGGVPRSLRGSRRHHLLSGPDHGQIAASGSATRFRGVGGENYLVALAGRRAGRGLRPVRHRRAGGGRRLED